MKSNFSTFAPLSLATLLGIGVSATFPEMLKAQSSSTIASQRVAERGEIAKTKVDFKPPKVGAPENRKGGASRGSSCSSNRNSLKALLPVSNLGLTVEKYPTFFVYIPPISTQLAEFELHEGNANSTVIYKTRFTVPTTPGIFTFSLPNNNTLQPLEIGKNYHWFFSIICDPQDRSEDIYVEGWVQRIQPSLTLANQLEKAAPRDRPALYAEAGIWHETIRTLAELRYSRPQDSTLLADWEELLKSVGLSKFAKEPLSR
jgi:hypothetical protein